MLKMLWYEALVLIGLASKQVWRGGWYGDLAIGYLRDGEIIAVRTYTGVLSDGYWKWMWR